METVLVATALGRQAVTGTAIHRTGLDRFVLVADPISATFWGTLPGSIIHRGIETDSSTAMGTTYNSPQYQIR